MCPKQAQSSEAPSPRRHPEARHPESAGSGSGYRTQSPEPATAGLSPGSRNHRSGKPLLSPFPEEPGRGVSAERAGTAASRASPEAHTRPISQLEFPLDEPSGTASRPGSGRDGVRGLGELSGTRLDLVPRSWTRGEEEPAGQAAPRRALGAELRFTCPPWQRRGGAERRAADPAGSATPRPGPRGGGGAGPEEHLEAPISAQGEGDVARCPELPRALLRELRGGGSQGRVLLAAAPGTSRPPRRRSHGDRKPSRRPERPALAPRAVPDGSWPPVLLDPSWFQAIVRAPEWTHFRHGGASPQSGETSPSYRYQHAFPLPPL